MCQWLKVDRVRRLAYYGVLPLLLGACTRGPAGLAPETLPRIAATTVAQWVAALTPTEALRYDLQWTYATQQGRARGRAVVRFVPPDSLRFDYRAPFGRSGAAVLVGDSVLWAEPADDVDQLIPIADLFWAAIGMPQPPPANVALRGRDSGGQRLWQFQEHGLRHTLQETRASEHHLQMELAQGTNVVGTADVRLDSLVRAVGATMTFPRSAAQFAFTVRGIERMEGSDPQVWKRP